ncbi:MAG: molybdopterin molybdenumtransferase MoeA, partial [Nannocystaceae bacterium]
MPTNVRMRGFRARSEVTDVLGHLAQATALRGESVPVTACAGRILATDIQAPINVPGFARAAVDGYAIRGEDSFGASEQNSLTLEV